MANPTTNFGWVMPTSTDLVTDLPADFDVFGQAVDTSLADLKGGTTGQILTKTTNADMDFTWAAPNPGDITGITAGIGISGGGTSGDVTVTNSMATAIDAKGDLIAGTGADTFARLAVGATNGHTLQVDSTAATGLKWAAAPSPSYTWTSFTPSFTQGVALTLSANTSRYTSVGDIGFLFINVTFSSAGTANNVLYMTLGAGPITPDASNMLGGWANIYDTSAATRYNGAAETQSGYVYFQSGVNKANASVNWGQTGSDFPIAIANGDTMWAFISYKKA